MDLRLKGWQALVTGSSRAAIGVGVGCASTRAISRELATGEFVLRAPFPFTGATAWRCGQSEVDLSLSPNSLFQANLQETCRKSLRIGSALISYETGYSAN